MNISIIVRKSENYNKYIVKIRKITGKSLIEIREALENEKPIYKCELFKNDDCKNIVEDLVSGLINLGAQLKVIKEEDKNIEEVSTEYLLNRINRFREIEKQTMEVDDMTIDIRKYWIC